MPLTLRNLFAMLGAHPDRRQQPLSLADAVNELQNELVRARGLHGRSCQQRMPWMVSGLNPVLDLTHNLNEQYQKMNAGDRINQELGAAMLGLPIEKLWTIGDQQVACWWLCGRANSSFSRGAAPIGYHQPWAERGPFDRSDALGLSRWRHEHTGNKVLGVGSVINLARPGDVIVGAGLKIPLPRRGSPDFILAKAKLAEHNLMLPSEAEDPLWLETMKPDDRQKLRLALNDERTTFASVRGPHTCRYLESWGMLAAKHCPHEAYADPAVFVPLLFPPWHNLTWTPDKQTRELCVVSQVRVARISND